MKVAEARLFGLELGQHVGGAVGAAVVDDEDSPLGEVNGELLGQLRNNVRQVVGLVVGGQNGADRVGGGGHRSSRSSAVTLIVKWR